MSKIYFVSGHEYLNLRVKLCEGYLIVYLDGTRLKKIEKDDIPAFLAITNGLKRSDKETVHHLKMEFWNEKGNCTVDASIFSEGLHKEEISVHRFHVKPSESKPKADESEADYYIRIVMESKPSGLIQTNEFSFQFD
jgi:hypothetical protein